jgi:glycosyltransferase involved in cell wall biosynthesis
MNDKIISSENSRIKEIIKSNLKTSPKYTIAIPTNNRNELLKQSVLSALNQIEYNNYDVLIVDNNSENSINTEIMLRSFSSNKISYYKNESNIGMVANWNRLFEMAQGDYLIMLHDDDLLYPNYLKTIEKINQVGNGLFDAIYVDYNVIKSDNNLNIPIQKNQDVLRYFELNINSFALSNIVGAPVAVCYRKEKVLKVGGFEEKYYPSFDYAFHVKFAKHYYSIKINNYPLAIYRVQDNESKNIDTIFNTIKMDEQIRNDIQAELNYKIPNFIKGSYFLMSNYYFVKNVGKYFEVSGIEEDYRFSKLKKEVSFLTHTFFLLLSLTRRLLIKLKRKKLYLSSK